MFNKPYFIVVFLLITGLFSSTAIAQISGYMGKRFSVGYGGDIGYAMFSRNSSGSSLFGTSDMDFPEKLFSFNYKHQAQMELVLSNRHVLGIQGCFGTTQFKALKSSDTYMSTTMYDGHQYTGSPSKDIYAKMKILTVGMYLKKFNSNTAPIGKYWSYKLAVLRYAADLTETVFPLDFPKRLLPAPDIYHTSAVFSIAQGTSRIYWKRLLVDTNFEFGLPFVYPGFGNLDSYDSSSVTYEKTITQRMNTRLWGNFLFNVNVNVSLLAF